MKLFADECVRLAWHMSVHDPPLVLDSAGEGDLYDDAAYDVFSRIGTHVDFVVWPALRKYPTGPVLQKGTVELKKLK